MSGLLLEQLGRAFQSRPKPRGSSTSRASDVAFVEIGEPDIDLKPTDDGRMFVKVNGYDSYNPKTGTVQPSDGGDIMYWAVDTDHDGKSFFATLMHFPLGRSDRQVQKFRANAADRGGREADLARTGRSSRQSRKPGGAPDVAPRRSNRRIVTTTGLPQNDLH